MKKTFINIAVSVLLVGLMVAGTLLFPRKLKTEVSSASINGFEKDDASEYLWLNELSSRIVFAVDYLANNATKENGYANGFEYDKVYMGPLEADGYKGVIYIKTETDKTGVNMYFDFKSEEQDGVQVCFVITMHADYDFVKDEVKKIQMNY